MVGHKGDGRRSRLAPLTQTERDAATAPFVGDIGADTEDDSLYWWTGVHFARVVDRDIIPDMFDAIVNSDSISNAPEVYLKLADAIDDDHEAIFIKLMDGDDGAITIPSDAALVHLAGKDADTTEVLQDITCNKDDVTFEALGLSSKTLLIDSALNNTVYALFISAGGVISVAASGGSTGCRIENCRFEENTTTPILLSSSATHVDIVDNRFDSTNGSVNDIALARLGGGTSLDGISIAGNHFYGGTEPSGFSVSMPSTFKLTSARIIGNNWNGRSNGILDITVAKSVIADNIFGGTGAVKLTAFSGTDLDTVVANNYFTGAGTVFQLAGADGDHDGLVLIGNIFVSGTTVLGSQDAHWVGNHMVGCTVNFQSKTGIRVIGGDMTGATLQNIPADIVFRNVKGQDDRGDYLPVDGAVDLGSDAKRFAELWLSSNADIEGNLQVDGNATIDGNIVLGGTLNVSSGDVTGNFLPAADDTYNLGSASKEWKDLHVDGTANIDTLSVLGISGLQSANIGVLNMQGRPAYSKITLTIDANDEVVVPTTAWVYLSPASGSTDNLDGIGAGTEGQIVFLTPDAGDDITLVHDGTVTAGKKLKINGEANVLLDEDHDVAIAIYDATANVWNVMVPGSAGAHTVASHSDTTATGAETETLTDGSDADALHDHSTHGVTHNAAHTIASHSDTTGTGAELETLTDGSDADTLHDHDAIAARVTDLETVTLWFPAIQHVDAVQGTVDDYATVGMDDTQKYRQTILIPSDFVSLASFDLIIVPDATETIQGDTSIVSAAIGEDPITGQTINADITKSVTADIVTAWDMLTAGSGSSSVLPTIAAGDFLGFRFDSDTNIIHVLGIKIVYVRT